MQFNNMSKNSTMKLKHLLSCHCLNKNADLLTAQGDAKYHC